MKLSVVIRKELLQLFFVFLSFALMVAVSYYFVSDIVEKQISVNAQEALTIAEISVRSDIREAEIGLQQVELLIESKLDMGASPEEIRLYIAELAEMMKSSWVKGCMNIYGIVDGHLMSGLYDLPPEEEYSPEQRPWYKTAVMARGKVGLSSPYTDWQTGKTVFSMAKILLDKDGNNYGVIALDVDYSVLSVYIEPLSFAKGSFGLLCDEEFTLIVHPEANMVGKSIEEIGPGLSTMVRDLRNAPGKVFTQRMLNAEGVPVVIIFRQIYNGWFLGIVTPVNSYFRDVNLMAVTLSVLGLVFMSILGFILIRLSLLKARSDEQNLGKSSFLARMSHEIRTPMNSILGVAELIKRKVESGEIRDYIEIINQSGTNLLTIINDILDFSKIESGRLQIQPREYYLASVINDMVNMMRPRIAEKSLDFYVNLESAIPARLFGDDMRLRQILTNLLSNAVKYTHKGFISLDVKMAHLDNHTISLIFSIQDSGIGIKNEDQDRLFDEFMRMDSKVNQNIEGSGLGLVISRALCRTMGGDVTLTSEYGKGSVFRGSIIQEFTNEEPVAYVSDPGKKRVLFYDWRFQQVKSITSALKSLGVDFKCSPDFQDFIRELEHGEFGFAFISSKIAMDCIDILGIREKPLQMAIMVEPGEISVYREISSILMPVYSITIANVLNNVTGEVLFHDNKFRIRFEAPSANVLIVDDISTNLRVAKELMAPYAMNVQTCLSGAEAVNLVKKNKYDIVFMDHMMPGMDGIEATNVIRSLESGNGYYRSLPIVALTANAISGQKEMFLENGINDFLAKPIEVKKLDEILERWLPAAKRMESNQPFPEDTHKEKKLPIVNIPGIDVTLGLRNCGGNVTIYFNILSDFCKDAEARLIQINDALAQDNSKLYVTLVHALKGAARSIGAIETGEKASWLEKAAARGNLASIRSKNAELLENLRTLINDIKTTADKYGAKDDREKIEISSLRLETLKEALAGMDIKAVNRMLMTFSGLALDDQTKELISEVEQHILMFEYDKAIEKINEVL